MKKYLLTLFSVLVSVTLMGQTSFKVQGDNRELEYTVIQGTNVSIKVNWINGGNINFEIPGTVQNNAITYTVTEIAENGFQYKSNIISVTIPETITKIGNNAFQGSGITSVTIPNSVTEIGASAFQNCNSLAEVNIGSGVTSIGNYAFANSGDLKEVTINGENLSTIGNSAFYQCDDLAEIFIPGSVTSVGTEAFAYCGSLHEVRFGAPIPDTLDITLGNYAFQGCHSMHSISLPKNLTEIPEGLLSNCHEFNEIIIPENVTSVGAYAFQNTHDCEIIFLGCGDCGTITIHSTAFQNCNAEDISFLCLSTGGVDIVKPNGDSGTMTWGNNAIFHVPCGMESLYADEITQGSNITIDATNCVSVSRKSGHFCLPETWEGFQGEWKKVSGNTTVTIDKAGYMEIFNDSVNKTPEEWYAAKEAWLKNNDNDPSNDRYPSFVPRKPDHPFYINSEHRVELNHSRHIYPFNSINKGVLVVNSPKGGELIERDSLFFDENYTIEVEYQIYTENSSVFITRNHHEATDITDLINNQTTCGDYRYENGMIRDTETRYLLNITQSGEENNYQADVIDSDYYEIQDGYIYYCRELPCISYQISGLSPYNETDHSSTPGFYKTNDGKIKHVISYTYNNITEYTTVTIDGSGNVTLHGTDYAYGHVKMHENLGGEIEIIVPAEEGKWNFVGAPFNGYDLWSVKIGPNNHDVTIVEFDYSNNQWSSVFSTVEDEIAPGEGFLAWPFYSGGIVFSTKRDYGPTSQSVATKILEEDFSLNNDDVVVKESVSGDNNSGRWMALANPYPAKLCVNSFVDDNSGVIYNDQDQSTQIQGRGVYVLNTSNNSFDFKTQSDKYDLGVGEGFFVNVVSSGENTITFKKNQLHEYDESTCVHENHNDAKSTIVREFAKIAMVEGGNETELLFAQNEQANQNYDIFDANKLFSMDEVAEPYFVTDNIALVKEEVKDLPYYATMNVKSFGEKEVSFKANYIPQGLTVSIIDGEEIISLNNGEIYTTNIVAGENSDRFKILFGSSVGLEDVENPEIKIVNSNRNVNISTSLTNLQIEVYNALGQKVYETKDYNFILNDLSAGAYMVKAFNKTNSQTTKIIIK